MKPLSASPANTQGFTLVEMSMVLAIVTLLLAGLVPTISGQIEQRRSAETKKQLEEIQQALIGFAIIKGRLPCPATTSSNGVESPSTGGTCSNFFDGYVPGATLGLNSLNEQGLVLDAWDNPIRYVVTNWNSSKYTTADGMATVGLSSLNPTLLVCTTSTGITATDCATGEALTADTGVPVVIFSTGKNGASGGTGADEAENLDGDRFFVSHTPTASSVTNGEFDDLVVWISNQVLLNRMVTAGKLP
ncbi:MAG: type II secretion system GspH family protein [Gammaproteobacteria bacterium]|nr:type II secretion system GspH family protein [Gammaproteobacteria bacterium]MBU1624880.1 type II secretion system GspH family protein [Gammaproteobacteria bacterium]MBU1982724.1 type II secretion system GspH family protein [Gammaproteobacteria bacterium]